MTTLTRIVSSEKGVSVFVRNHPLIAYFVLAYAGMMKVLESGWINVIVFTAMAVLLVLLTRGTLGYSTEKQTQA